jgi:PTS system nitrogen regulatory IIA component
MSESTKLYKRIDKDDIKLNLRNTTAKGVLKELVSLVPIKSKAKDILLKTLIKREQMGSTGVGRGIAIPHARTLLVRKCEIEAGLSKKGVDFNAFDGKPVHLFFLIVAPPQQESSNSYLITLGKVAELSRNIAKDKRLFNAKRKKEFLEIIEEIEESG